MSGGHYEYLYHRINELEDMVVRDLYNSVDNAFSDDEYAALKRLQRVLKFASEGARLAEWWLSADTDSDEFVEWSKTV